MHFDDLKVIWDSQHEDTLYALDEKGLHNALLRKSRRFKRRILARDIREISIGIGASFIMLVILLSVVFDFQEWINNSLNLNVQPTSLTLGFLVAASLFWFYYSIHIYVSRKKQQQIEQQFPHTLQGDIDRELSLTDYQIRKAKTVLWWGLIPIWIGSGLFILAVHQLTAPGTQPLAIGLSFTIMAIALIFDVKCKQRPIEKEYIPRKQELESLRKKLEN